MLSMGLIRIPITLDDVPMSLGTMCLCWDCAVLSAICGACGFRLPGGLLDAYRFLICGPNNNGIPRASAEAEEAGGEAQVGGTAGTNLRRKEAEAGGAASAVAEEEEGAPKSSKVRSGRFISVRDGMKVYTLMAKMVQNDKIPVEYSSSSSLGPSSSAADSADLPPPMPPPLLALPRFRPSASSSPAGRDPALRSDSVFNWYGLSSGSAAALIKAKYDYCYGRGLDPNNHNSDTVRVIVQKRKWKKLPKKTLT